MLKLGQKMVTFMCNVKTDFMSVPPFVKFVLENLKIKNQFSILTFCNCFHHCRHHLSSQPVELIASRSR